MSLRLCEYFNIISTMNYHILAKAGGYKTVVFLYYIVGANCVRPFLIRCELTGDRRSPLRFNVFFNLTTPDHRHISDNSLGRSKPLPYIVGYYSSLRAKHLLLFTLHFSLFSARKAHHRPTTSSFAPSFADYGQENCGRLTHIKNGHFVQSTR